MLFFTKRDWIDVLCLLVELRLCRWQHLSVVVSLTSGTAGSVQGQHSLDGHIHGWDVEGLKHDLGHLLPVGLGVQGGLSEQGGVLLRGHTQLIVKGVVPDLTKTTGDVRNNSQQSKQQPGL